MLLAVTIIVAHFKVYMSRYTRTARFLGFDKSQLAFCTHLEAKQRHRIRHALIAKTQLEYDNVFEKAKKTFYNYLVERKDRRQFTLCAKNFIERCYTIKDRARLQL